MSVIEEVGRRDAVDGSLREAVMAAGQQWSAGLRCLIVLVRELDESGEWTADGSASCAHWIADALDLELSTAREWVRVGRSLLTFDVIGEAFAADRLSYSKVRALTRVATVENQAELCELAERVPARHMAEEVAKWLAHHETPAETKARHHRARSFSSHLAVDGMVVGSFRLPPADAAKLTRRVDELVWRRRPGARTASDASADAFSPDSTMRWPTIAQQRADAFMEIVTGGGGEILTEIVVHVRGDGCTLDDGTPIAGSTVERIAPEAFLRVLIHDAERRPINASGRHRHPTGRQRRVVRERDRVCVDCGATDFLQYDHDPDFEESRRTVVEELWLRCWDCHRGRHRKDQEALRS